MLGYANYLKENTTKVRLLERVVPTIGFLIPSRFGDTEIFSETGYALSNLLGEWYLM